MTGKPATARCRRCRVVYDMRRGHSCPLDERHAGGAFLWIAIAIVAIVALLVVRDAYGAAPRSAGALVRAIRLVDAHAWRDGRIHRGRIHGCEYQARVFPDGEGHVAVSCGWLVGIAFRDRKGRWLA